MKRIFRHTRSVAFSIAVVTLALPAAVRAHDDAEKTFKANCAACHAPDGSGSTAAGKALKAQDLRSPILLLNWWKIFSMSQRCL